PFGAVRAERRPQVAALAAGHAPHLDVDAEVAAPVVHAQPRVGGPRAAAALVDEVVVRKVVEMPGGAGQHEPGRHREWPTAGPLARTVAVEEPGVLGPAGTAVLEVEGAGVDRGELVTGGA